MCRTHRRLSSKPKRREAAVPKRKKAPAVQPSRSPVKRMTGAVKGAISAATGSRRKERAGKTPPPAERKLVAQRPQEAEVAAQAASETAGTAPEIAAVSEEVRNSTLGILLLEAKEKESQYAGKGKVKAQRKKWQNQVLRDVGRELEMNLTDEDVRGYRKGETVIRLRDALRTKLGLDTANEVMPNFMKS